MINSKNNLLFDDAGKRFNSKQKQYEIFVLFPPQIVRADSAVSAKALLNVFLWDTWGLWVCGWGVWNSSIEGYLFGVAIVETHCASTRSTGSWVCECNLDLVGVEELSIY